MEKLLYLLMIFYFLSVSMHLIETSDFVNRGRVVTGSTESTRGCQWQLHRRAVLKLAHTTADRTRTKSG